MENKFNFQKKNDNPVSIKMAPT